MRHVDKIRLRRLKDRVSVDNSREMDKRVSLHVYIYLCRRTSRMNFVEKVFGTHSDRELKYIYPIIDKIEKLRPTMQAVWSAACSQDAASSVCRAVCTATRATRRTRSLIRSMC